MSHRVTEEKGGTSVEEMASTEVMNEQLNATVNAVVIEPGGRLPETIDIGRSKGYGTETWIGVR